MNDKLKKTLKHYIDLDFYANTVDNEILELYEDLEIDCEQILASQTSIATKDAYNLIMKAIREEVNLFGSKLEERLNIEADNVKNKETDFLKVLYPSLVIGDIATSKVLFAPIDNRDTVKQFVERTKKNIIRSYDNAMRSGYLFGQSSKDVKNMAEKNLKQIERGMENGVHSAVTSYAKTTDRIVFLKNEKEVVWCSLLDGNECIVCGNLHGTRYKSVSEAPGLQHFGCRCVLLPSEEITEPMPTYEEYLEELSEEEQREILGKNRYEMWKNDGIKLEKFINNGRKLRLNEIDTEE